MARAWEAARRVDGDVGEEVSQLRVHLGAERRRGDLQQQRAVGAVLLYARIIQNLEGLRLGQLDSVAHQPRVHTVR